MDSTDAFGYALTKPGAWPDNPFHEERELVKVANKIFLFPGQVDGRPAIIVKNTAEAVEEVRELIDESYELVVAKLPVKDRP